MENKTFVDSVQIFDAETPQFTQIDKYLPKSERRRGGGFVFLDTSPPELTNNGCNFIHKSFFKENRGHIVDENGGKNRVDVGESTCFDRYEFGLEFVQDEIIGFVSVLVIENERVTKMHSAWYKVKDREDVSDFDFGGYVYIFAEKDGPFLKIWSLTRGMQYTLAKI